MIWIKATLTPPKIPDGEKSLKLFCWYEGDYFEGEFEGMICPNGNLTVTLPSTNKREPYLPHIAIASHWMVPREPAVKEQ